MQDLAGKSAFITGGANGIGFAMASSLAREGVAVAVADIDGVAAEVAAKKIEDAGGRAVSIVCDVTSEEQIQANIRACVDRFGQLDTLCNIAGILLLEHFDKITPAQFRKVLEVNLVGPFMLCQAALPHLLESKGSIVNTSSTSALAGMPYGAAYGTSKGGVSALTRTLAVEFGGKGVRCNAVNPGSIQTAMMGADPWPEGADWDLVQRATPSGPARGPEVVAATIALLASDDGLHINGEEIRVDGGTLA